MTSRLLRFSSCDPVAAVALLAAAALLAGCDLLGGDTGEKRDANVAPNVQLADNVPIQADTLDRSLAQLYWDGGDPDGFITGYEYRIFTQYCNPECEPFSYRDTSAGTWEGWTPEGNVDNATGWVSTDAISDSITFDSQAQLNRQLFQVRAIDDNRVRSVPDERSSRYFYTPNSSPPVVTIAQPTADAQRFGLRSVNDWWKGILLTYDGEFTGIGEGRNESKEIVEFGWRVDDAQEWNWTPDTSAVIGPNALMQTRSLYGEHTIHLTARDNTGLVSHEGDGMGTDSVTFRIVEPTFTTNPSGAADLLIVDETDESAGGGASISRTGFNDSDVDSLYRAAFTLDGQDLSVEQWDYQSRGGAPSREELAGYRAVLWHADDYAAVQNLPNHVEALKGYMEVGGDFMMSGARLLPALANVSLGGEGGGVATTLGKNSFLRKYLHVQKAKSTNRLSDASDFGGAIGLGSFSTGTRAKAKIPNTTIFRSRSAGRVGLTQIGITRPAPFSEGIYAYQNLDPESGWGGERVGVRYYGTVFDTIALGFPMWYMRDEDMIAMGQDMLRSLRDGN
jgi:hypothetical protein